jgi:2-keto-4-pentenoate hydratase/2-oxohepta-3-ene-1,7-dioic acid hydratase in catechol pathway
MFEVESFDSKFQPGKIVCVARNYAQHAKELGNSIPNEPVFFMKPASAISKRITLNEYDIRYETELVLQIRQKKVVAAAVGLDLTRKSLQEKLKAKGLPWERSKAFKGSVLCSKFHVVNNVNSLSFNMSLNGIDVQKGCVSDWLFSIDEILKRIDDEFGLIDDDLIFTGTPEGTGDLHVNDKLQLTLKDSNKIVEIFELEVFP